MANSAEYLQQLFGLQGKTAVVIGGTGVLGGAICDCLASAGAYVVVAGRSAEAGGNRVKEIQDAGGSAEFIAADVTSSDDILSLLNQCVSSGHIPDILVNGAGVNAATPFLEITQEEWDRIFNINLGSVRTACQIFAKYWLNEKRQGSIINIASMSAIIPLSRVFTYSASKAAVLNLTKNLAREWAEDGIRVNALSPGFFPAEQNRKVLTPERVESIMKHTPANRFGESHELAGAVLLLASNVAGSFITGDNLAVDGGFSSMTI
ncbi:SDR family oxidoreductase [Rubinisphaera sp.]|uniref:SDR family oxidoreductase n=1 Tax=Rubinisphaera sp. TaxID=2024857 RepID=UPI000C104951|nr:SDR family oxidoreductase [Rubinisphaera sp.]MBV07821.1 gluconate 5-dehydrogenase [Rubinisphaera sp.]HCS53160.1 gluconate 5-dehydrogenase [Planctomycetaceae bacterium]|tara:strand:- start:8239 stop:9030 length:792 start_codon:yes stop_codon:yes gene_type:complete